jgi:hypothetical protein
MNALGVHYEIPFRASAGPRVLIIGKEDQASLRKAKKNAKKNAENPVPSADPLPVHQNNVQDLSIEELQLENLKDDQWNEEQALLNEDDLQGSNQDSSTSHANSPIPLVIDRRDESNERFPQPGVENMVPSPRHSSAVPRQAEEAELPENPPKRRKVLSLDAQTSEIARTMEPFLCREELYISDETRRFFKDVASGFHGQPPNADYPIGNEKLVMRLAALHLLYFHEYPILPLETLKPEFKERLDNIDYKMVISRLEAEETYAMKMKSNATKKSSFEAIQNLASALCHSTWSPGLVYNAEVLELLRKKSNWVMELGKEYPTVVLYHCFMLREQIEPMSLKNLFV